MLRAALLGCGLAVCLFGQAVPLDNGLGPLKDMGLGIASLCFMAWLCKYFISVALPAKDAQLERLFNAHRQEVTLLLEEIRGLREAIIAHKHREQ